MKRPVFVLILLLSAVAAFAQSESARVSGRVTDSTGAVIVGAQCTITNIGTNASATIATNRDGIYVFPDLRPAMYRLIIQKDGFHTVVKPGLELHVQDAIDENFTLAVGSTSETVTVTGGAPVLDTQSAAVSTVVDSQFVENMPLNGRSFQSLIFATPGVIITTNTGGAASPGEFSVNGQRTDANYVTIDGVSANFAAATNFMGSTAAGTTPALTVGGGTNGLVSVDAMQEFRIQTSGYAPEFGRQPGAQISITTKSGANAWHGTAYDYLRNDLFDARNFFDFSQIHYAPDGTVWSAPLPKPELRQNDFGGTFSGPIWKDHTFFFFSYEGLRLRQPEVAQGYFPIASETANLTGAWLAVLQANPVGPANGTLEFATCGAATGTPGSFGYVPCATSLTAGQSNPSTNNAYSLRIDHKISDKLQLFGRWNHAPTNATTLLFNSYETAASNTDTATAGLTWAISPTMVNDLRGNWSHQGGTNTDGVTSAFGATLPTVSQIYPTGFTAKNQAYYSLETDDYSEGWGLRYGTNDLETSQRQWNFIDTLAKATGKHQLKFGVDWRRIVSIHYGLAGDGDFGDWANGVGNTANTVLSDQNFPITAHMDSTSLFAQDTWKATRRLTLTYGLRWDLNHTPVSDSKGEPLYNIPSLFTNPTNPLPLTLTPGNLWATRWSNIAPRVGAAFQVTPKTVLRAGFGQFYDLGYGGGLGDALGGEFPYSTTGWNFGSISLDPNNPQLQMPPFTTTLNTGILYADAFDPHLKTPYTLQWNVALERELGSKQTITATYAGAHAYHLLQGGRVDPIGSTFDVSNGGEGGYVLATRNGARSQYNSLQLQYMRRMSHGLQAMVNYTFSKAMDMASSSTYGWSATSVTALPNMPMTPSDFDRRHNFAAMVSYETPKAAWGGAAGHHVLNGWALDGVWKVQSGPPLTVETFYDTPWFYGYAIAEPVPGTNPWFANPIQPAGKQLNPWGFEAPTDPSTTFKYRNSLYSPYGIDQVDFALRRRFSITERFKLDFRAELFNIFNHPMFYMDTNDTFWFGPYSGPQTAANAWDTEFGGVLYWKQTINQVAYNWSGLGTKGGQNPLYAPGSNRSAQFTLKLSF